MCVQSIIDFAFLVLDLTTANGSRILLLPEAVGPNLNALHFHGELSESLRVVKGIVVIKQTRLPPLILLVGNPLGWLLTAITNDPGVLQSS